MKSGTKQIIQPKKEGKSVVAEVIGMQLAFAILGFLFGNTQLMGGIYPFGASIVSACPQKSVLSVAIGCSISYLLMPDYTNGAKYIAVIAIITLLRYFLPIFTRKNDGVTAMIISGGSFLVVSIVTALVDMMTFTEILLLCAETMVAAGAGYFMERSLKIFVEKEDLYNLSQYETTGLVVTFAVVILSLAPFEIAGISPARITAILAILLFARYGRDSSSTLVGVAVGFAISISANGLIYIAGGYSVGGLIASVFSPLGGIATCLAFILSNSIIAISYDTTLYVVITIYEGLIASAIFMAIPSPAGRKIVSIFDPRGKIVRSEGFKRGVLMRLDFAGSALSDVSDSVEEVAHKLRRMHNPVINDVFRNVKKEVCSDCDAYSRCFGTKKAKREKEFKMMEMTLREYGKMEVALLPTEFSNECLQKEIFAENAGDYYTKLMLKKSANTRVDEFRSIVVDQFKNISEMLFEMSDNISKSDRTDIAAEEKVYSVLRDMGLCPLDVSANIGRFDRMVIEIRIRDNGRELKEQKITEELSRASGRKLCSFSKTAAGNDFLVSLCEKAELLTEFVAAQHNCNNSELCGDSYGYFLDGRGNAIMIISDGMGNGGRAAVDGAMAQGLMSRLIRAGIGFESALRIVNSAMLYKSVDESLSTVDLCCVDLYSGRCEFYKAGAAKSLIIKKNKIEEVECNSMPIGILKDISFEKVSEMLSPGDIVLMMSDGAADVMGDWAEEEIGKFAGEDLQDLVDVISMKAKVLRHLYNDDDITVLALKVRNSE